MMIQFSLLKLLEQAFPLTESVSHECKWCRHLRVKYSAIAEVNDMYNRCDKVHCKPLY